MLAGRGVHAPPEGPVHRLGCTESAGPCDFLDRVLGRLEQMTGGFEPHRLHVLDRRDPDLPREDPTELPFGEVGPAGKGRDRQILGEVIGEPGEQVTDRFAVHRLGGQDPRELTLSPGAAQIDHELARDRRSRPRTMVVGHQRQRQVDAGRDPGRGLDVAVGDVDRVRLDGHRRVPALEQVALRPVRGGASTVEQAAAARRKAPEQTDVTRRA